MYELGSIVTGKVTSIERSQLIVKLRDGSVGKIGIKEISDYYVSNINDLFHLGKIYPFQVVAISINKGYELSWKSINPRFSKNSSKFLFKETKNGFNKLREIKEKYYD